MAEMEYVLTVLLAVIVVTACNATSVRDASDDEIMARLAALENTQREGQSEIRALRQTVSHQKEMIDKQRMKLRTLEQDITTMKVSQHRQAKQYKRTERLLQMLLKAGRSNAIMKAADIPKSQNTEVTPPRRHSNVKQNVYGIRKPKQYQRESVNVQTRQVHIVGAAFSVYLDQDVDLRSEEVIKYNKVITNEGNGYNIHTGLFTCTMDGMYLFSFFLGERDTRQQFAALKVNSQNMVDAVAEGFHATQDLQGGNTVAVRLNQGDSVWVESMQGTQHVEGGPLLHLTTFTGAFLYP